jgi:hypothetical protein
MSIAFQGFAVNENLSEATNDGAILNNLGIAPIAEDLSLLFNNLRNVSTIVVLPENIQDSVIFIENSLAVFSNKTPVNLGNTTFYIKDSNGIDQFSLSTQSDLSDTVTSPQSGTYIRSDEVTAENISNLSIRRRVTSVDNVENTSDFQISIIDNSVSNYDFDLKAVLESVEGSTNFFKFRYSNSIKIDQSYLKSKILESNGVIIIEDPDGTNDSGVLDSNPGLFIYNPDTESGVRAFSSNENPWEAVGLDLEASTSSITVRNLNFSVDQISLLSKGSATLWESVTPSEPVNQTNFTHLLPVEINGETYYLCLNAEA